MIKHINVSTKITLLILGITMVAVVAISFFSYDYQVKAVRQKHLASLTALAENYASYFDTYFQRGSIAVQVLQQSDRVKNHGGGGEESSDFMVASFAPDITDEPETEVGSGDEDCECDDFSLTSNTTSNDLAGYLAQQKSILQVEEITITTPTGSVIASSNPEVKGNFIEPDGAFSKAKNGIYFTNVIRDKKLRLYDMWVAGS